MDLSKDEQPEFLIRTKFMKNIDEKTVVSFEENFKLLETLAQELQENKVSLDELVPKVKKASEAFKVCKEFLKETKEELTKIVNEIEV